MAEKYIVFKIEDWENAWGSARHLAAEKGDQHVGVVDAMREIMRLITVTDGVVIRCQDVFAGPALAMYANGIQLAIKMAETSGVNRASETTQRLSAIADYFHEMSEKAYDESYKIPD